MCFREKVEIVLKECWKALLNGCTEFLESEAFIMSGVSSEAMSERKRRSLIEVKSFFPFHSPMQSHYIKMVYVLLFE